MIWATVSSWSCFCWLYDAKSLKLCLTLCDPRDGSPPVSAIPGILQARTLEWVAISFSSAWKWKEKVKLLSRVWLFATPWTAAYQAPPSMGFPRQEYWSGVPLPSLSIFILLCITTVPCWLQLDWDWEREKMTALWVPASICFCSACKFICQLMQLNFKKHTTQSKHGEKT